MEMMLVVAVLASACLSVLGNPMNTLTNLQADQTSHLRELLSPLHMAPQASLAMGYVHPEHHEMQNLINELDVASMVKSFDPKFVVINEQREGLPSGVHDALVKSLISDLHGVDIPVVYAQKQELPYK